MILEFRLLFYCLPEEESGMRAFVMLTFGLAVALAPVSALAQTPPAAPTPGYSAARDPGSPGRAGRAEGAVYDTRRHAARAD